MNTDIRLSTEFWQHPKIFRLERKIGLKGIRSLQILWCWCAKNRPDGSLAGLDDLEIEFVADWRGKKGTFISAIADDWLDQVEDGYVLHEWADYNPYQVKGAEREQARKEKARNAANARWGKEHTNNAQACLDDATSNAQAYAQDDASICSNDAQAYANGCLDDATSNAQAMPTLTSTIKNIKEAKASFVGNGLPPEGTGAELPESENADMATDEGQEIARASPNALEAPHCPHEKIIELYHKHLPELPHIKSWENARRSHLQARWRENWKKGKYRTQEEGLAYWEKFFKYVRTCPWLMGQVAQRNGGAFRASLDWIVMPNNFAKIIEGRYEQRVA